VTDQRVSSNAGLVWGLIGVMIFSVSLPVTRVAVAVMDPLFVGAGRGLLAGLLSAITLIVTRSAIPTRNQLWRLAVTSVGVTIGFPLFSSIAMQYVPAGHGAIVNGLLPLATVALGSWLLGYRLRNLFWLAAIIGSATAVGVVIWQSESEISSGDTAMLLAVVIAAVGYVYGGKLSAEIGGWRTICWANVMAAPILIWPAIWYMPTVSVPESAWLAFGYLGVFSMFLGFFAWYHGLALGGIPRVSQVQLLQPFLTMLWAWPIDGEVPSLWLLGAAGIVVGCIWVARRLAN
jgi:drug/metabolite transporter (DMT)-like permease